MIKSIFSRNKKINAFTLLEMLVVIGIIIILVGMGAVSYTTAQKKARDSRRKTDLKAIQNAMEQYYSICGYTYPTPTSGLNSSIFCASPSTAILPTVPVDPKSATPYLLPTAAADAYQICSNSMESESITGYCLSNQQ